MVEVASLLTFLWLGVRAASSVSQLSKGGECSLYFADIILFLFCGLPLAEDLLFGMPDHSLAPNFYYVSRDAATSLLYCGYISLVPLVWWWVQPARRKVARTPSRRVSSRAEAERWSIKHLLKYKVFMWVLLVSPTALLFIAPNPRLYLDYTGFTLTTDGLINEEETFHIWVGLASMCVVIAVALLVTILPKIQPHHVLVFAAALGQAFWLNGKRAIVAIALLTILYALWYRGALRGTRMVASGLAVFVGLCGVSVAYQAEMRGLSIEDGSLYYDNIRMDYGRDAVIKQAIYAEINSDSRPILEYRGQSLLFDLTFFIPREFWPDKPWPYAVYATSAMLGNHSTESLGSGVTTSILDEAIANLSWAGMLVGPLIVGLMCRMSDQTRNPLAKILAVLNVILILLVHLVAFMPFFLAWAGLVLYEAVNRRLLEKPFPEDRRRASRLPPSAPLGSNILRL